VKLTHNPRPLFRDIRLSTRLGLTLTGMLVLAAVAQTLLYFKTRDATLVEADSMYQSLAEAIEVAATQIGPEGWKDPAVLNDYRQKLRAKGLRDIQVTEAGRPFPDPVGPAPGKKKGKGATPRDIVIKGVIGTEPTNRVLQIPLVIEGKLYGHIQISYSLENIREQLADNFRGRLYGLLGIFAFGLAVLLILIQNATKPLDDLAEGAARVAEGRLDVTIRVDRDDEIGRLASTFNRMTEKLRERQELEVRLTAAEKRAEIGHLASGLAHEIKNPLNALSLGLDVLRRRHRPADATAAAEYSSRIETLREEINRLASLINNFLAYGRPLSMTLAPTDLSAILQGTLSDLSEIAEQARVTIQSDIPENLPRVNVDGSLIKSAVWNLVQNGVQSMERTGGTLRVALALANGSDEGAAKRLELTVEDEGPGISPTDLPRLFEPYFSKKEGGLGLGLAMVRRIIEDHGGKVQAEMREGAIGARFRISLPVPL
jgi:signal transduction histidine kinase